VQAMSTAVSGATLFPSPGDDYGYWIHAFDPGVFRPIAEFKREVGRLLEAVRSSRPSDPSQPVHCPGDRSRLSREKAQRDGIEVDSALYEQLQALASTG